MLNDIFSVIFKHRVLMYFTQLLIYLLSCHIGMELQRMKLQANNLTKLEKFNKFEPDQIL